MTAGIKDLGKIRDDLDFARRFVVTSLPVLEDWPASLELPSRHFVLFLAIDARKISDEAVKAVAARALGQGLVSLCAWGPDCERIHDLFDSVRSDDETDETVIMTTWHSKETLREALWFFAWCAFPAQAYEPSCSTWLAVTVGEPEWDKTAEQYLAGVVKRQSEGN